jgi:hypothetical protein
MSVNGAHMWHAGKDFWSLDATLPLWSKNMLGQLTASRGTNEDKL